MGTGRARALPLALALLLACSDVAVVAAQGTERIQGTRPLALPSFLLLLAAMLWLVDYALPAPGGCSSGQSVLLVAFVVAGMDLISRADPIRPWEDERVGGWGERDQLFNTDASTLPLLIHERTTFSSVHNQFHPGKGHDCQCSKILRSNLLLLCDACAIGYDRSCLAYTEQASS